MARSGAPQNTIASTPAENDCRGRGNATICRSAASSGTIAMNFRTALALSRPAGGHARQRGRTRPHRRHHDLERSDVRPRAERAIWRRTRAFADQRGGRGARTACRGLLWRQRRRHSDRDRRDEAADRAAACAGAAGRAGDAGDARHHADRAGGENPAGDRHLGGPGFRRRLRRRRQRLGLQDDPERSRHRDRHDDLSERAGRTVRRDRRRRQRLQSHQCGEHGKGGDRGRDQNPRQ